jgi:response regulator RpfG family c-di-GMP phosphodiesterase
MLKHVSPKTPHVLNIIIADDEILIRQTTSRIIISVSQQLGLKINIIESSDGMETAYLVYKAAIKGIKISMIFSDENMYFLNGTQSANIILEMTKKIEISEIPFYLVTSYNHYFFESQNIKNIKKNINKPLCKNDLLNVFEKYVNM